MADASTLDPFALIAALYILVLTSFVGYEVVSKGTDHAAHRR